MSSFTIELEGIGLVYQKDNEWEVLFPFDVSANNCHKVRFVYPTETGTATDEFAGQRRKISIIPSGASSTHSDGGKFPSFLNIVGADLHDTGIELKNNWNNFAILLNMPNTVLVDVERTKSRFQISGGGASTKPASADGKIGYSATLRIDASSIEVRVTEESPRPGEQPTIIFSESFTNDCLLRFDNNCYPPPANTEKTDYDSLYQHVLKGRGSDTRTFEVTRDPRDRPTSGQMVKSSTLPNILSPQNTNLPAGYEGVPCHLVGSGSPPDGR